MADPSLSSRMLSSLYAELSALLNMYSVLKKNPDQDKILEVIKEEIIRLYSEISLRKSG
jgi:hypothetical protein